MFYSWNEQAQKLKNGEITKEEYDRWRYYYPDFDHRPDTVKVAPTELSDMLTETLDESN